MIHIPNVPPNITGISGILWSVNLEIFKTTIFSTLFFIFLCYPPKVFVAMYINTICYWIYYCISYLIFVITTEFYYLFTCKEKKFIACFSRNFILYKMMILNCLMDLIYLTLVIQLKIFTILVAMKFFAYTVGTILLMLMRMRKYIPNMSIAINLKSESVFKNA